MTGETMVEMGADEVQVVDGVLQAAPGKVLLVPYTPEEKKGDVIIPSGQAEHAQKLGNHFPLGRVLAVGPVIRGDGEKVDEQLHPFCEKGDIVWYDYRGTGKLLWQNQEIILAPRQYIVCRVAKVRPSALDTAVMGEVAP